MWAESESVEENPFSFKMKTYTVGWVLLISPPTSFVFCIVLSLSEYSFQFKRTRNLSLWIFVIWQLQNETFFPWNMLVKGYFFYVLKICFITIFAVNNLSIFIFLSVVRFDLFVFQHQRMVLQRPLYGIWTKRKVKEGNEKENENKTWGWKRCGTASSSCKFTFVSLIM